VTQNRKIEGDPYRDPKKPHRVRRDKVWFFEKRGGATNVALVGKKVERQDVNFPCWGPRLGGGVEGGRPRNGKPMGRPK